MSFTGRGSSVGSMSTTYASDLDGAHSFMVMYMNGKTRGRLFEINDVVS